MLLRCRVCRLQTWKFIQKIVDKSCEAAFQLGRIRDKGAVKPLIRLLNGEMEGHIYQIVSEIDDEFMDYDYEMVENSIMIAAEALGKIGDERAIEPLIKALENNYISGAGLDVLEEEPPPINNPLIKMNNVVITPHLASISQESNKRSLKFAIDNTTRLYQGEEPLSVILPE